MSEYVSLSFSTISVLAFSIYIREYTMKVPETITNNIEIILMVSFVVYIISYFFYQWKRDLKKLCSSR